MCALFRDDSSDEEVAPEQHGRSIAGQRQPTVRLQQTPPPPRKPPSPKSCDTASRITATVAHRNQRGSPSVTSKDTADADAPTDAAAAPLTCFPAEVEEGNVEYKLKLHPDLPAERIRGLATQMAWRCIEGGGSAIYRLGVNDDGRVMGLPPFVADTPCSAFAPAATAPALPAAHTSMADTLSTLYAVTRVAGAVITEVTLSPTPRPCAVHGPLVVAEVNLHVRLDDVPSSSGNGSKPSAVPALIPRWLVRKLSRVVLFSTVQHADTTAAAAAATGAAATATPDSAQQHPELGRVVRTCSCGLQWEGWAAIPSPALTAVVPSIVGVPAVPLSSALASAPIPASLPPEAIGGSSSSSIGTANDPSALAVQPSLESTRNTRLRVGVIGGPNSGKSTWIACVTAGVLDNGEGAARCRVFRHRHEVETGKTSSASYHMLGLHRGTGVVVNGSAGGRVPWRTGRRGHDMITTTTATAATAAADVAVTTAAAPDDGTIAQNSRSSIGGTINGTADSTVRSALPQFIFRVSAAAAAAGVIRTASSSLPTTPIFSALKSKSYAPLHHVTPPQLQQLLLPVAPLTPREIVQTSDVLISLVDCAGHTDYIRTALSGLSSSAPEVLQLTVNLTPFASSEHPASLSEGRSFQLPPADALHAAVAAELHVPLYVVLTSGDRATVGDGQAIPRAMSAIAEALNANRGGGGGRPLEDSRCLHCRTRCLRCASEKACNCCDAEALALQGLSTSPQSALTSTTDVADTTPASALSAAADPLLLSLLVAPHSLKSMLPTPIMSGVVFSSHRQRSQSGPATIETGTPLTAVELGTPSAPSAIASVPSDPVAYIDARVSSLLHAESPPTSDMHSMFTRSTLAAESAPASDMDLSFMRGPVAWNGAPPLDADTRVMWHPTASDTLLSSSSSINNGGDSSFCYDEVPLSEIAFQPHSPPSVCESDIYSALKGMSNRGGDTVDARTALSLPRRSVFSLSLVCCEAQARTAASRMWCTTAIPGACVTPVPVFVVSNVTGAGMQTLLAFLSTLDEPAHASAQFPVDECDVTIGGSSGGSSSSRSPASSDARLHMPSSASSREQSCSSEASDELVHMSLDTSAKCSSEGGDALPSASPVASASPLFAATAALSLSTIEPSMAFHAKHSAPLASLPPCAVNSTAAELTTATHACSSSHAVADDEGAADSRGGIVTEFLIDDVLSIDGASVVTGLCSRGVVRVGDTLWLGPITALSLSSIIPGYGGGAMSPRGSAITAAEEGSSITAVRTSTPAIPAAAAAAAASDVAASASLQRRRSGSRGRGASGNTRNREGDGVSSSLATTGVHFFYPVTVASCQFARIPVGALRAGQLGACRLQCRRSKGVKAPWQQQPLSPISGGALPRTATHVGGRSQSGGVVEVPLQYLRRGQVLLKLSSISTTPETTRRRDASTPAQRSKSAAIPLAAAVPAATISGAVAQMFAVAVPMSVSQKQARAPFLIGESITVFCGCVRASVSVVSTAWLRTESSSDPGATESGSLNNDRGDGDRQRCLLLNLRFSNGSYEYMPPGARILLLSPPARAPAAGPPVALPSPSGASTTCAAKRVFAGCVVALRAATATLSAMQGRL